MFWAEWWEASGFVSKRLLTRRHWRVEGITQNATQEVETSGSNSTDIWSVCVCLQIPRLNTSTDTNKLGDFHRNRNKSRPLEVRLSDGRWTQRRRPGELLSCVFSCENAKRFATFCLFTPTNEARRHWKWNWVKTLRCKTSVFWIVLWNKNTESMRSQLNRRENGTLGWWLDFVRTRSVDLGVLRTGNQQLRTKNNQPHE